ncbi:MAG: hypothetical protein AUH75_04560, partial [Gemmatimonadetes bacterium 13_1_40CM_4_65_7]
MTKLGYRWNRGALSVLLFVLVLPGLGGCVSAVPTPDESPATSNVDVDPWPRRLTSGDHTFSVFEPQYESWDQGRLSGRAAVVVENPVSPEPQYGVITFTARTEVDKETRMVTLEDVTIAKADFPTAPDGGAVYLSALRQALSGQPLTMALDRLQAQLEVERMEDPGRIVQVKNDAPRIIVSEGPALLVRIDGQPVLRQVASTGLLRVINTRVLLLLDRSADKYYLWLMNRWLAAPKLDGPWGALAQPPASLQTAKETAVQSKEVDLLDNPAPALKQLLQAGAIPTIYVSSVPAELIVLQGKPALAPIVATDVLEVTNTDTDLFLYTPQQEYYALLSGRWFRAGSLQGPWEFVASGELPEDFVRIPESHPKGAVLASISGTPQARQAVIANDIPQTATISRSEAKLTLQYDGPPVLKPIEGTTLQYVVNASVPVIRVDASSYYAVQNGVWFVAPPTGPWTVATSVPSVIYTIPVSSPLHYVTYAYVYGSTPDVVYTGYTPGYLGTVVAPGPLVVYGTGYVYPAWASTFWYPAPVTWGWGPLDIGFGVDVFTGFAFGFGLGPYWGWHGAWGWHGGCCWGWHHGISHVNVYHHWGDHAHLTRNHFGDHIRGRRFGGGDVYAGRDGQVYRRDGEGRWHERTTGGSWAGVRGPSTEHERWHQARELGRERLG